MARNLSIYSLVLVACGFASVASAARVVPAFDTFGTLAGATFGGSGIPNHAVAITTLEDGANTITLGLTAHQRNVGPNLVNNGAGVFEAPNGFGDPGLSKWNWAFYAQVAGGGSFADYTFLLKYDLNPAGANDQSTHGTINLNAAVVAGGGNPATTTLVQDSQNLGFAYLATGIPTVVTPPGGTFDANALGQYTFSLQVFDGPTLLGLSAIQVNAVPEPVRYSWAASCAGSSA